MISFSFGQGFDQIGVAPPYGDMFSGNAQLMIDSAVSFNLHQQLAIACSSLQLTEQHWLTHLPIIYLFHSLIEDLMNIGGKVEREDDIFLNHNYIFPILYLFECYM